MLPSRHPPNKRKHCCNCTSGTCTTCTCANNNRDCISCRSKNCTRTSKSKNIKLLHSLNTQMVSAPPAELGIEKPIPSSMGTYPHKAPDTNLTPLNSPSPAASPSVTGPTPPHSSSQSRASNPHLCHTRTTCLSRKIPSHKAGSKWRIIYRHPVNRKFHDS